MEATTNTAASIRPALVEYLEDTFVELTPAEVDALAIIVGQDLELAGGELDLTDAIINVVESYLDGDVTI